MCCWTKQTYHKIGCYLLWCKYYLFVLQCSHYWPQLFEGWITQLVLLVFIRWILIGLFTVWTTEARCRSWGCNCILLGTLLLPDMQSKRKTNKYTNNITPYQPNLVLDPVRILQCQPIHVFKSGQLGNSLPAEFIKIFRQSEWLDVLYWQ